MPNVHSVSSHSQLAFEKPISASLLSAANFSQFYPKSPRNAMSRILYVLLLHCWMLNLIPIILSKVSIPRYALLLLPVLINFITTLLLNTSPKEPQFISHFLSSFFASFLGVLSGFQPFEAVNTFLYLFFMGVGFENLIFVAIKWIQQILEVQMLNEANTSHDLYSSRSNSTVPPFPTGNISLQERAHPVAPQQQSVFFRIPLEVRVMIYDAYLDSISGTGTLNVREGSNRKCFSIFSDKLDSWEHYHPDIISFRLFETCQLMYEEIMTMSYKRFIRRSTLSFDSRQLNGLISKIESDLLCHIEISDRHTDGCPVVMENPDEFFDLLGELHSRPQVQCLSVDLIAWGLGARLDRAASRIQNIYDIHGADRTVSCIDVGIWQLSDLPKFKLWSQELVDAWRKFDALPTPRSGVIPAAYVDDRFLTAVRFGCKGPAAAACTSKAWVRGDQELLPKKLIWECHKTGEAAVEVDLRQDKGMLTAAFLSACESYALESRRRLPIPLPLELWPTQSGNRLDFHISDWFQSRRHKAGFSSRYVALDSPISWLEHCKIGFLNGVNVRRIRWLVHEINVDWMIIVSLRGI